VNGKKFGLVFEEHREDIDEVLDTHTPVLTEERELFIDKGGQMNVLIEGDNLAVTGHSFWYCKQYFNHSF
jgi:adenine-specific DNA-methyltransferase